MSFDILEKFAVNFFVGGLAGIISKTVTAPLDRIKIILQNQDSSLQVLTGERQRYNGFLDIIRRLPKEQGFFSFWRGNAININRYALNQAFMFSFNAYFRERLRLISHHENINLFVAGGLAGSCCVAVLFPLEFCMTRIIADVGTDGRNAKVKREFLGFSHCVTTVYKREGIKGYYRGLGVAILGNMLYRSLFFGLFDSCKRYFVVKKAEKTQEQKPKLPLFTSFFIAQTTTIISSSVAYPFDTVLRRLMLDSARSKDLRQFKNTTHAVQQIYRKRGIRGFYFGLLSNIVKTTGSAIVLVIFDEVLFHYDIIRYKK